MIQKWHDGGTLQQETADMLVALHSKSYVIALMLKSLAHKVEALLQAFGMSDFFGRIGMLRLLRVARILRSLERWDKPVMRSYRILSA